MDPSPAPRRRVSPRSPGPSSGAGPQSSPGPLAGPVPREVSPWVLDALLGAAVAATLSLLIALDPRGSREPDALAFSFAVLLGGLMLVRRRTPRAVLLLTMAVICGYYILDYPPIGMAVPLAAALYSAAEAGRPSWGIVSALAMMGVSSYFRLVEGEPLAVLLGYELVSNAAIMAAAIALGDGVRSRRARREQQAELNRLMAVELEREAEARVQAERVAIARDLHDSIGHRLSVISLHAGVAEEEIGHDDVRAAAAVHRIREAGRDLMFELRSVVRMLRSPAGGGERAVVGFDGIAALVDRSRAAGVVVELTDRVPADVRRRLPSTVQAAAYRVVQEALTNAMRHAPGADVSIEAGVAGSELALEVRSFRGPVRGSAADGGDGNGAGIAGMRERVRLMGGDLAAGPLPDGGFSVTARLPLPGSVDEPPRHTSGRQDSEEESA